MRNLLALFGLLVIGFAGTGWYMGWYKLSYSRNTDGNIQIKTDLDTKKVESDSSNWFKNAATVVGTQAEKAAQDAKTNAPEGAPGATPGPGGSSPSSPFNPLTPPPQTAPVAPQGPFAPDRGPIQLLPPK